MALPEAPLRKPAVRAAAEFYDIGDDDNCGTDKTALPPRGGSYLARASKVAAWPEKGFFDAPEQILLEERGDDDRDDFLQNGFFSMDNQRTPES